MDPFELRGGDLLLTTPTAADVPRLTEACQDPQVQEWTTVPTPYTRADAEEFVSTYVPQAWAAGSPAWAVRQEDAAGYRLVGMVGLDGVHAGSAEIGYWLVPEARGRGVMHRAVGLALGAGFDRLGLERVEWRAYVGNWASWRVAWRHGFRKEGTVRGLGVQRGQRRDEWIGSLLVTDPRHPAEPWDGPTVSTDGPTTVSDPETLVREFHRAYGLPVAEDGPDVARDRVHMRMALVAEELAELVTAVYGAAAGAHLEAAYARAVADDDGTRDTVAAADALGDLVYVLYGMALECGIPLNAVLTEIHAANLSKLGADGRPVLRADGKVLKGPGYAPPDVAGVLVRGAPVHRPTAQ